MDAYLVEHPVDITALEGQTISPAIVHATTSVDSPSGAFNALSGESITGDSIIENMSGYSAIIPANTGWTISNVYTSVCKNGNKVTFVAALHLTKTAADANASPLIIQFYIPKSVADKIVPEDEVFPSAEHICDIRKLITFGSGGGVEVFAQFRKYSDTQFNVILANEASKFTIDDKNFLRFEATFLLGENLIA